MIPSCYVAAKSAVAPASLEAKAPHLARQAILRLAQLGSNSFHHHTFDSGVQVHGATLPSTCLAQEKNQKKREHNSFTMLHVDNVFSTLVSMLGMCVCGLQIARLPLRLRGKTEVFRFIFQYHFSQNNFFNSRRQRHERGAFVKRFESQIALSEHAFSLPADATSCCRQGGTTTLTSWLRALSNKIFEIGAESQQRQLMRIAVITVARCWVIGSSAAMTPIAAVCVGRGCGKLVNSIEVPSKAHSTALGGVLDYIARRRVQWSPRPTLQCELVAVMVYGALLSS
jgi:hypothetical protein